MRVLHLYDGHEQVYEGRGSVPGVVWNVARETAAAGHDVTVLERQWDGLPAEAEHEGVRFERLSLRTGADEPWTRVPYETVTSPAGLARLVTDRTNFAVQSLRRLRSMEFDALHVHLPFAANVLATIAPGLRDRMVYTAHLGELRLDVLEDGGDDGPDVPSVLAAFSPDVYLAKRAARTTVLNPTIESVFTDYDVSEDRLQVIPNGVDVDRFGDVADAERQRVRDAYDVGAGPTLLFVGTLMPRKGVTEFVEAVARLVDDRHDDVRVILAGEDELDGTYVERVETLIQSNEISSNVSMPGFVPADDLPALYAVADAFVMPSLEEGFGMTVVEAMAAGTPVVGTRVGGIPALVDDGETGELVPSGDASALAAGIERLLDRLDASGAEPMARAARRRADDYAWDRIGAQFESVYEEVVA